MARFKFHDRGKQLVNGKWVSGTIFSLRDEQRPDPGKKEPGKPVEDEGDPIIEKIASESERRRRALQFGVDEQLSSSEKFARASDRRWGRKTAGDSAPVGPLNANEQFAQASRKRWA